MTAQLFPRNLETNPVTNEGDEGERGKNKGKKEKQRSCLVLAGPVHMCVSPGGGPTSG